MFLLSALAGMQQLYAVNDNAFDFNDNYTVNNSASIAAGSFTRVAYFVELGPKWVWVSMDTFNTDDLLVGVPKAGTNIVQNGTVVTNIKVESSAGSGVTPISTTGNSGIIEFWASNHNANGGGLFGSNNSFYDWKDSGGSTAGGHGSMQVFAFTSPAQTSANTIFGITAGGGAGIGNQGTPGSADTDWTFGSGTVSYAHPQYRSLGWQRKRTAYDFRSARRFAHLHADRFRRSGYRSRHHRDRERSAADRLQWLERR